MMENFFDPYNSDTDDDYPEEQQETPAQTQETPAQTQETVFSDLPQELVGRVVLHSGPQEPYNHLSQEYHRNAQNACATAWKFPTDDLRNRYCAKFCEMQISSNTGTVGWQCSVFKSHSDAGLTLDVEQLQRLFSKHMEFDNQVLETVTVRVHDMDKVLAVKPYCGTVTGTLQKLFRYANNIAFTFDEWSRRKFENTDFTELGRLFPGLTGLTINYAGNLQSLHGIENLPGLRWLNLDDCDDLIDLSHLADCTALQTLVLGNCTQRIDLSQLVACTALHTLNLEICHGALQELTEMTDLRPLQVCTGLKVLDLSLYFNLGNVFMFEKLPGLQSLTLKNCANLVDLSPIALCTALHTLDLRHCQQLIDLLPLRECQALEMLVLDNANNLVDLSPLEACHALRILDLRSSRRLKDLSPLEACRALRILNLVGCDELTDLQPLQHCNSLEVLVLKNCKKLTHVSPLANCTALKMLDLSGTNNVIDVLPLAHCKALHTLICHSTYINRVISEASSREASDTEHAAQLKNLITRFSHRGTWRGMTKTGRFSKNSRYDVKLPMTLEANSDSTNARTASAVTSKESKKGKRAHVYFSETSYCRERSS